MSIDTTKQIKKVTYNGTEIPLAGSSSSSSETTQVTINGHGLERVCALIYQTSNNKTIYDITYDTTESFVLNNVLLNGIICFFDDPLSIPFYVNFDESGSYGIEPLLTNNSQNDDTESPGYRMFKVTDTDAILSYQVVSN